MSGRSRRNIGPLDAPTMAERAETGAAGGAVGELLRAAERARAATRLPEAEALCRRALTARPNSAEPAALLGLVLADLKRPKEAIACYRRAIALDPKRAATHNNLGIALKALGRHEAAIESFRRALALKPDFVLAHLNLGDALRESGQVEAAVASYRRALVLKPDSFEAHNNLGIALRQLGEAETAVAGYRRALEIRPGDADVLYNLSIAKRFAADSPEIAEAEAALGADGLSERQRGLLHFALGKMYDDCGLHEKAFAHFREGNRLKRPRLDRAARVEDTSRLIAAFSKGLLRRLRPVGHESERPVFIVGMPRSGTTLVEQIVASHPRAFGGGELGGITGIAGDLGKALAADAPYPENVRRMSAAVARSMAARYLKRLHALSPDAERVTNKGVALYLHLGLAAILFPGARILHVRRDPLDTCLSCYFHYFTGAQDFTYDLEDLGLYYRQYERLMAHWRRALPRPILEVRYEELVADQEAVSRRIIAFLGLEWDDRCLEFYRTKRAVQTASADQVRRPIYASSVGRWRAYEAHLGPLKRALGLEPQRHEDTKY